MQLKVCLIALCLEGVWGVKTSWSGVPDVSASSVEFQASCCSAALQDTTPKQRKTINICQSSREGLVVSTGNLITYCGWNEEVTYTQQMTSPVLTHTPSFIHNSTHNNLQETPKKVHSKLPKGLALFSELYMRLCLRK